MLQEFLIKYLGEGITVALGIPFLILLLTYTIIKLAIRLTNERNDK